MNYRYFFRSLFYSAFIQNRKTEMARTASLLVVYILSGYLRLDYKKSDWPGINYKF